MMFLQAAKIARRKPIPLKFALDELFITPFRGQGFCLALKSHLCRNAPSPQALQQIHDKVAVWI